jgi:hypothetical protein
MNVRFFFLSSLLTLSRIIVESSGTPHDLNSRGRLEARRIWKVCGCINPEFGRRLIFQDYWRSDLEVYLILCATE